MSRPVLTVGSLFAGIGGIELGLERAGMRTVWQVEKDDFARKVLAKHWPDVRRHDDVCTFPPGDPDDWRCDLICGGFPCQDISNAGRKAGIDGRRSGLWSEFARVIRTLRPRYVLLENVTALLARGADRVLGELAACGYDAEWDCLPASAFGSWHQRDRFFLVAYPQISGRRPIAGSLGSREAEGLSATEREGEVIGRPRQPQGFPLCVREDDRAGSLSDLDGTRLAVRPCFGADARPQLAAIERANRASGGWWGSEPDVVRMVHGISARLVEDRIRGLGNAVVPQVARWIGERIMEMES